MTPEQQAAVDRLMGLAEHFRAAEDRVAKARVALRTAIEELAQQAAEARDDYMRLLREKQSRTLAAIASQPLVPAGCQELQSAYPWVWRYEISPDGKATTGYAFKTHEDCVEHCEPCGVKLVPAVQEAPPSMTQRLQQRCSDWGVYWRASDAHGVQLTFTQAIELLRDALGVEVEVGPPEPEEAPPSLTQEWCTNMAKLEDGAECAVGPQEAPAAEHAAEPTPAVQGPTEREQFERWAEVEGFSIHRDANDEKYRDYHRATTRFAWSAWQARAALSAPEQAAQQAEPVRAYQDQLDAETAAQEWFTSMVPAGEAPLWNLERKRFEQPSEGWSVAVLRRKGYVMAVAVCIRDDFNRTNMIRWAAQQADARDAALTDEQIYEIASDYDECKTYRDIIGFAHAAIRAAASKKEG